MIICVVPHCKNIDLSTDKKHQHWVPLEQGSLTVWMWPNKAMNEGGPHNAFRPGRHDLNPVHAGTNS